MFLDKGEVFGWGNNEYKQLLQRGEDMQYNSPINITQLNSLEPIVDVAAGGSCCIAVNGKCVVIKC